MNLSPSSPTLTLIYVFLLLSILMGVERKSLTQMQKGTALIGMVLMCAANEVLCGLVGLAMYAKLLFFAMHLPMFLLMLYLSRSGVIKTAFMILTALVFTAPAFIVSNILNNHLDPGFGVLLLSNVCVFVLMLLMAQFIMRKSFNYLICHASNPFFLLFSLIPLAYYVYIYLYMNADISSLMTPAGFGVRLLPNLEVFGFYCLLPLIYKTISEKMLLESSKDALEQELSAAANQIALLNEADMRMAVYRHDIRHHVIAMKGLLDNGKVDQVKAFLETAVSNLDAIPLKRFCENEIVNLLCASYQSQAKQLGVTLKIDAAIPQKLPLSDTELCSMISNGLENALLAASKLEEGEKWVAFSCHIKQNQLFVLIENPYAGNVVIRDGLPVSSRDGHGYGCYSIQTITQRNGGLCSFEAKDGLFSLRLSFPLAAELSN